MYMPGISEEQMVIPKNRLLTVISLIMLIEHKELGLDEIMKTTGMKFHEARSTMQNIVNIRLADVIPTNKGIPRFKIIDEQSAKKFVKLAGGSS
jgi:hypothetical protein